MAGESWTLGYSGTVLASVTDPRAKVVLAASWNANRVRRIRVLHETTDFRYAGDATTATNLLGWSTVYGYGDSGITESITDRTGATSEVAFDAGFRPTTVTRDGTTVERIGYDDDGCLQSLWRPEGETTFTCSRRGVTVAKGAWTARYRYSERRVVESNDPGGRRAYRYADDGSLAGVTTDGLDTELRANADGMIAEVSRGDGKVVSYTYTGEGEVSSIDYEEGGSASFSYDRRGLRTRAQYVYGDAGSIVATMAYDAAGNLTRHGVGETGGTVTDQTYRIGDYNEVLWVRTGDGSDESRPDLTFGYDAAGRLLNGGIGERTATVEYDALDRATRLVVDGETLLEETYGPDDIDAAAREDQRTAGVLVAAPASPVFGNDGVHRLRQAAVDGVRRCGLFSVAQDVRDTLGSARTGRPAPCEPACADGSARRRGAESGPVRPRQAQQQPVRAAGVPVGELQPLHGRRVRRLSDEHLSCGDSVYIVGVGVKTVTDRCPDCTPTQLDNYTTASACHDVGHLGTFKTIKL